MSFQSLPSFYTNMEKREEKDDLLMASGAAEPSFEDIVAILQSTKLSGSRCSRFFDFKTIPEILPVTKGIYKLRLSLNEKKLFRKLCGISASRHRILQGKFAEYIKKFSTLDIVVTQGQQQLSFRTKRKAKCHSPVYSGDLRLSSLDFLNLNRVTLTFCFLVNGNLLLEFKDEGHLLQDLRGLQKSNKKKRKRCSKKRKNRNKRFAGHPKKITTTTVETIQTVSKSGKDGTTTTTTTTTTTRTAF